jgi:hypothetical protein
MHQFCLTYFDDGPHHVLGYPLPTEKAAWKDFLVRVLQEISLGEDEDVIIDDRWDLERLLSENDSVGFVSVSLYEWT